jgi:hypothetical protein
VGKNQSLVVHENFNPKTDPLLSSSMQRAALELESSATFLAKLHTKLVFSVGIGWYFLGILPPDT